MPVVAEFARPSMVMLPAVTFMAAALPDEKPKASEEITPRLEIDSVPVAETSISPALPDEEWGNKTNPPLVILRFPVAETPMLPALPVPPGCARVRIPADKVPRPSIVISPAPTMMDPELFEDGAPEKTA